MKIMNDVESPAQGTGEADVPCIRVTATPGMTFSGNFNDLLLTDAQ